MRSQSEKIKVRRTVASIKLGRNMATKEKKKKVTKNSISEEPN